jgi:hypothetical protein
MVPVDAVVVDAVVVRVVWMSSMDVIVVVDSVSDNPIILPPDPVGILDSLVRYRTVVYSFQMMPLDHTH